MKAIAYDRYGPPSVLELRDVPKPSPGPGDVMVRVQAASLNARDWHVMRGDPYLARPSFGTFAPRQNILGTDLSGTVESVGAAVTDFQAGDEVFSETPGALAEYVCGPAEAMQHKPSNLTHEQAAAIPLAANTALVLVRDAGRLADGQRVLVNGASGGVGTFAIQLARHLGGLVTAVCSTRNVEQARALGAAHVVDYTNEDFAALGVQHDVVIDLAGSRSLRDLRHSATRYGTIVLSGGGNSTGGSFFGPMGLMLRGKAASSFISQRVRVAEAHATPQNLSLLRDLCASGDLVPVIDRTYPLARAVEAMHYLEAEHTTGKIVITF